MQENRWDIEPRRRGKRPLAGQPNAEWRIKCDHFWRAWPINGGWRFFMRTIKNIQSCVLRTSRVAWGPFPTGQWICYDLEYRVGRYRERGTNLPTEAFKIRERMFNRWGKSRQFTSIFTVGGERLFRSSGRTRSVSDVAGSRHLDDRLLMISK